MICKDCENRSICKHTAETEEICKKISTELHPNGFTSPITIKVECKHFKKQHLRQDGIWNK